MNWALIGYGGMGAWHADKLLTLPEVRVCGIYDIDPERGELAQERGLPVYPSLEALLSDKKVEFVTIATPNDVHRDIAIAAMKARMPQNMRDGFAEIEHHYLAGPWVLGERLSLADIYLFVVASWLASDGVAIDEFPKVAAHTRRMLARPAVQEALIL